MASFPIVPKRQVWYSLSALLLALSVGVLVFNWMVRGTPLNLGVEFTGGSVMTLRLEKNVGDDVKIDAIRKILREFHLQDSGIQKVGDRDLSIRSVEMDGETRGKIIERIQRDFGKVDLLEVDTIGPVIGGELRSQALWALFWATMLIMGYIAVRFELFYSVAGLLALYHDTMITIGVVAFLWMEVDMTFVAAILTIMGYSINDTIIIYDRVRENIQKMDPRKNTFEHIVNLSVNQTLPRSINTVLAVLFMDLMLLLFGGATIQTFALTLFVGFSVGAYSSIFLAAPLVVSWKRGK